MSKIVIGINTLTEVEQSVYSNHCQFWYRLGRNTKHDFILHHPRRMSIDRMRNITAKVALDAKADYLMFIDDDVLIPLDTLDRLIAADVDIAAGWTIIRGYPYQNMFFRWVDELKTSLSQVKTEDFTYDEKGNIPVDAVGFSCVLIKCDLLRKMSPPFFVTGPFNTEDIYFCVKARKEFPETTMIVDPRVETAHNLGAEYIEPKNVKLYKSYMEAQFPEITKERKEEPGELEKNVNTSVDFTDGPTIEDLLVTEIFGATE